MGMLFSRPPWLSQRQGSARPASGNQEMLSGGDWGPVKGVFQIGQEVGRNGEHRSDGMNPVPSK